jgi:general secretion pathway protein I
MPPRIFHRKIHGFTLLEVMVAMAVIGIALIAVIKSTSNTTANTIYLQQRTLAHWVALDRLAELRIEKDWPSRGVVKDDIEAFNQRWQWIQTTAETAEPNLRRVDVSVILTDSGDEDYPLATMSAFFLNPEIIARQ